MNNKAAVIGNPVKHSLSPAMHNAAFQHLNLDWNYEAVELPFDNADKSILELFDHGYSALNVTMPFKDVSYSICSPQGAAKRIKSVNTLIQNSEKEIIGYSTDGDGFIESLKYNGIDFQDKSFLVIGAGGAARSICDALFASSCPVFVTSRKIESALEVVNLVLSNASEKSLSAKNDIDVVDFDSRNELLENFDVIVNATPVGMTKDGKEDSATPVKVSNITENHYVIDTIYHPLQTELLKGAHERGAKTFNGIDMLVFQGAKSFELFTGKEAPVEIMRSAVLDQINSEGNL